MTDDQQVEIESKYQYYLESGVTDPQCLLRFGAYTYQLKFDGQRNTAKLVRVDDANTNPNFGRKVINLARQLRGVP